MIVWLALAGALPAYTQPLGLKALGGLAGCWSAPGQVRGRDATSIARGEWHLGRRYFVLHVKARSTSRPYEAAITYGAGEKPDTIGSFWMDTFGGLYEPSLGLGVATADGFALVYRFPDAVYANRFVRRGKGWTWTIMEQAPGKPDKLFARYELRSASCQGMRFDF
jgi:hypothetical protein